MPEQLTPKVFYFERKFKVYDFFLPALNLLCEIDGDYWHFNQLIFNEPNETQKINIHNDVFKDDLARGKGFSIKRYWGSEVMRNDFKNQLIKDLC